MGNRIIMDNLILLYPWIVIISYIKIKIGSYSIAVHYYDSNINFIEGNYINVY